LKKIYIVKDSEVEVNPFILEDFTRDKILSISKIKTSKKALRKCAKELNLEYDEACLSFAKKMLDAQIKRSQ